MKRVAVFLLLTSTAHATAQVESSARSGRQSIGVFASYSPTSSHILIGTAEQRRIFTSGLEYTRRVREGELLRLDYSASLSPVFRESDPVLVAMGTSILGVEMITPIPPERVDTVSYAPLGSVCYGLGACSPIYPVYGRSEKTFGVEVLPIGGRLVFNTRWRAEPTFLAGAGFVTSMRNIPVDLSSSFNFEFTFGPGVQVFLSRKNALRIEYVYRHISNAYMGKWNPGIDQGVFRLCLAHYR